MREAQGAGTLLGTLLAKEGYDGAVQLGASTPKTDTLPDMYEQTV